MKHHTHTAREEGKEGRREGVLTMSKLGALRHTATWLPLPLYDMPSMVCLETVTEYQ